MEQTLRTGEIIMNFEIIALRHAEACAVEGAYFYEGSMFFNKELTEADAVDEFRLLYPNTIVSPVGREAVFDFVD